jgi:hypothetical protein
MVVWREGGRMDDVIRVLVGIVAVLALFVFPFVAAPYLVRRFGGSPDRIPEGALACPRCGSAAVVRLEADRVTPFPGYECRACDLSMRPPGTRGFYVAVLAVCVVLLAVSAWMTWENCEFFLFPYAFAVGGYSAYQLLRPVPVPRRPGPPGRNWASTSSRDTPSAQGQ